MDTIILKLDWAKKGRISYPLPKIPSSQSAFSSRSHGPFLFSAEKSVQFFSGRPRNYRGLFLLLKRMKVWVADQVGNIKSHIFNNDGSTELNSSIIETVSTPRDHGGYVQIMAHAKWKTSNKYIVITPPIHSLLRSVSLSGI